LDVFIFATCIFQIINYSRRAAEAGENPFVETLQHCIVSYLLALFTFILSWLLGGLCSFHVYLICVGQTTNEHLKGMFPSQSPFSRGVLRNFMALCCQPSSTSRFDLMRKVKRGDDLAKQPAYVVRDNNEANHIVSAPNQGGDSPSISQVQLTEEKSRSISYRGSAPNRSDKLLKKADKNMLTQSPTDSIPSISPGRDHFRLGSRGVDEFEGTHFVTEQV
jgi:hypothetical protein